MPKVSAAEGTDIVYSNATAALSIGCCGGKSFWMQESSYYSPHPFLPLQLPGKSLLVETQAKEKHLMMGI